MNKRIESYVDELFAALPKEQHVSDVKEELLSNLSDKYADLITEGKTEEEAYILVIASIGNIEDLVGNNASFAYISPKEIEKKRNMRNAFLSLGVSLFAAGFASLVILVELGYRVVGFGVMSVLYGLAFGLVAYGISLGNTRYKKMDNSFVENYKEKVIEDDRTVKLRRSVSTALWSVVLVVYLSVSFLAGGWEATWIIILFGFFIQFLALYFLAATQKKRVYYYLMLWSAALIVYFIVSFAFEGWAWSWIILLVTLALQEIVRLFTVLRKSRAS